MSKHVRDKVIGVIKYGIGFGLLAWIISSNWEKPDGTGLKKLLSGPIDYAALAVAAVLMTITVSLQIFRWFLLVRALDLPFTVRNAYRLGLIGYFYNTVLPGSVGGDLLKGYFIAKEQPSRRAAAVATVIIDRAMGLFGLILFVAVGGSLAWFLGNEQISNNPVLQDMVKINAGLAFSAIAVYLLLGLLPSHRADRFAGRLKHIPKAGHALAEVWYAVWMYRQRMKTVVLGVLVTAVAHLSMVTSFYFASRMFAVEVEGSVPSFAAIMVVAPIGFIVQAIPLSPGGVGVGEAAFGELFKLSVNPNAGDTVLKAAKDNGIASRLALRLIEWFLGFIGYLVFLRMKKELPMGELEAAKEESTHGGHVVDPPEHVSDLDNAAPPVR